MNFQDFLNESSKQEYAVGDVVKVVTHNSGVVSGGETTYNIEKVTSSQIQVYDKNTKETIKFNIKTLRGINTNSHLMIVK